MKKNIIFQVYENRFIRIAAKLNLVKKIPATKNVKADWWWELFENNLEAINKTIFESDVKTCGLERVGKEVDSLKSLMSSYAKLTGMEVAIENINNTLKKVQDRAFKKIAFIKGSRK